MPIIDADDVPDDHNSFHVEHITWNPHNKIREFFDYPQDPEFFGNWLQFFYSLSDDQKHTLRRNNLNTLSVSDFPQPFNPIRRSQ